MYKNEVTQKYSFQPKINNRSRSIINDKISENESCVDEVYIRLFNDYEEHKERQKMRNQESLPTFKPRISKNCSTKNMFKNPNVPFRSGTNPYMNIINNNLKKKYRLNKSIDNNNEIAKSEILFCDIYNNNIEKYLNTGQSGTKKQTINKSQGPTMPTNPTHANVNYTDNNTDVLNSKYIILEKPYTPNNMININDQNMKSQIRIKKPYLPQNVKQMIENNCSDVQEEEKNEEDNNNNNNNQSLSIKQSDINISDIKGSNYDNEDNNAGTKNKYRESLNKNSNNYADNDDIDQSIEELMKKKFPNIRRENLEKNKKYYVQTKNETIKSEDSEAEENNLYKLNIRNDTPHVMRQNVVLASKDCSELFDIPDMEDDDDI